MFGFLNRVELIGNLGRDPEARITQTGARVVTLTIATSESWSDQVNGERRQKTEWHRIVIWNENLGKIAERYLTKGSKVFLEGKLTTRKWQDQSGADRYSTEIHLTPYNGTLTFLDNRRNGNGAGEDNNSSESTTEPSRDASRDANPDAEIPF
jgi:single-strand DNA-binding protein